MKFKKKLEYLDPYTYLDKFLLKVFGKPDKTEIKIINWIAYLLYSLFLAFVIYQMLSLCLGTALPLATVVSGSMEPSFYRGDIMIIKSAKNLNAEIITLDKNISKLNLSEFATMEYTKNKYNISEVSKITINNKTIDITKIIKNNNSVVVYKSNLSGREIIHRVVVIINANDGSFVLTKGDNGKTNYIIDEDCTIHKDYIINGCLNVYPVNTKDLLGKKIAKIPYVGYLKLFLFRG